MASTIAKIGIFQKLRNKKKTSQGQVQYLKLNTHSVHSPLTRTYAIKMCSNCIPCSLLLILLFFFFFKLSQMAGLILYQSNHPWLIRELQSANNKCERKEIKRQFDIGRSSAHTRIYAYSSVSIYQNCRNIWTEITVRHVKFITVWFSFQCCSTQFCLMHAHKHSLLFVIFSYWKWALTFST